VALYYGYHDGRRETDIAAELLGQLPELPDALISHRFGLDDAARAFDTAGDRAAGAIKVVVDVR
jgi:threonine dehydrogenase-like Zn-dependent dehydrogenase